MWAGDNAGKHPDAASSLVFFWKSCWRSCVFSVLRESALLCKSKVGVTPSHFPSWAAETRGGWVQGLPRLRGVPRLNWGALSPQRCEIAFLPKEGIGKIWIGFANRAVNVEFPTPRLCRVARLGQRASRCALRWVPTKANSSTGFFPSKNQFCLSQALCYCSFPQMQKATTVSSSIWLVI